jgi:hypothetical protein
MKRDRLQKASRREADISFAVIHDRATPPVRTPDLSVQSAAITTFALEDR